MPMIKDPSAMNSAFTQSSINKASSQNNFEEKITNSQNTINDNSFTSLTSTNSDSDAEKQSLKEASEAA